MMILQINFDVSHEQIVATTRNALLDTESCYQNPTFYSADIFLNFFHASKTMFKYS
jgi:hypothetical protein